MKKNNKNDTVSARSLLIIITGLLITLNVIIALANPHYASTISHKLGNLSTAISGHRSVFLNEHLPALAQGGIPGINVQKTGEAAKKDIEGAKAAPTPAATAPAGKGAAAAAKKRKRKPIDPETMQKVFNFFNMSLLPRDVILAGQEDKIVLGDKTIDKPYISASFRDNPFDEQEQGNLNPNMLLNKVPPEPFYPPPGHATINVSAEEFKKYVESLNLNGIIVIGDNTYALINLGSRNLYKKPGEDFKEKFVVNVDDVNLDAVLVSDEFGNKGLLEMSYRKGFQVQPIENSLFITNMAQ